MKILYVTFPSSFPWSSDFAAQALAEHSRHDVSSTCHAHAAEADVIHFHNIQCARESNLEWLKRSSKVVSGVRGWIGYEKMRSQIPKFDAVAVNVDPALTEAVSKIHPRTYVLPVGADKGHFTLLNMKRPARFTIGWVGRDHKPFKNADLLPRFGYPYKKATYNSYIPYSMMPRFYHIVNALAVTSSHEGLCRPIIEAAMTGLPIVSSDVGAARMILEDEWIIRGDPRKKVAEYKAKFERLEDPVLAEEVGLGNRERATKFDWREIAPLYDAMWEELA